MNEHDALQNALARLEENAPAESLTSALTAEDAALVKTAEALRAAPHPAQSATQRAAQRLAVLQAAQHPTRRAASRTFPRWTLALGLGGLATVLMACAALLLMASLGWWPTATARTARMVEPRGFVEIQTAAGLWLSAKNNARLAVGQSVRTGPLSSVTLAFEDGSQATLGPNTALTLSALHAPRTGPRTIQLHQTSGDTTHTVAHNSASVSVYEVSTPAGTGRATGTAFQVSITADDAVRFKVTEGAILVSTADTTLPLNAGESTEVFDLSGVLISTAPWNVSGVAFATDADTEVDPGLRVGNRVRVQGQVLPDGARLADRITQIDEGQRHAIQFTARVQSVEPWIVGNVTLTVDSKTKIIGAPAVDDLAEVKGNLLPSGEVLAKSITRVDVATATLTTTPTSTPTTTETPTPTATPDTTTTPTPTPTATQTATPTLTLTPGSEAETVTLCHIPPGNPGNAKTLTVGRDAVKAHLAHGDTLGTCPAAPESAPDKKKKP